MTASGSGLFPTSCPVYFGLTQLYKAAGGASLDPLLTGWMNEYDPCDSSSADGEWEGITCANVPTPAGGTRLAVTRVSLSSKGLAGSLPSEAGGLTDLTSNLRLNSNSMVGSIPTQMGRLTKLTEIVRFTDNKFQGSLPTELGNLVLMKNDMHFSGNEFTGSIPTELRRYANKSPTRYNCKILT